MAESRRGRQAKRTSGARGLTTRGRCLLAGGIAASICAVVLDERDLLRVGIFAIALPLIAMAVTAARRSRLTAEHQVVPERLRPGTPGNVRLIVGNNGGRTSTIEVIEKPTPGLTPGLHGLLPALRPGAGAWADMPLRAAMRGRYVIGPPTVRVADPFGLWEDHRELPVTSEVLVVPAVVPLHGLPTGAGLRSAASGRAAAGAMGGDPDVGIRAYRTGDDIRTIHWRASARHDDLMVRLEEPVSHGGTAVMLDHRLLAHHGSGAASSLETAVTLAASVSLHLLAADHQVTLLSHTGSVIAQGHDIADDVLARLAVLGTERSGTLRPEAAGTAGLLVAIMGDVDDRAAARLVVGRGAATRAVALLLDTPRWAGREGSVALPGAAAMLRGAGWRVSVIRHGDDLAQAWAHVCQSREGFERSGRSAPPVGATR